MELGIRAAFAILVVAFGSWPSSAIAQSGSSASSRPSAASAARYVPSRTPWGDPDLQGTYTNKHEFKLLGQDSREEVWGAPLTKTHFAQLQAHASFLRHANFFYYERERNNLALYRGL